MNTHPRRVGRYYIYDEIASGGMASVCLGKFVSSAGFSRTVAVKCLHPRFAEDPEFVAMFLDEARVVARIAHPNVVPTLDVVVAGKDLFLVMEYVHGETLSSLLRAARRRGMTLPARIVASILVGTLHGLHAAHEATSESGEPLDVVHRDVSPQNILVGSDGVTRVLDFGIAKAVGRLQNTREGQMKGKLSYLAPEQFMGGQVDRRADVFAAAIVLWEALTGERLFHATLQNEVVARILSGKVQPPSELNEALTPEIDALVLRGLRIQQTERFTSAREMAIAIEQTIGCAPQHEVGELVLTLLGDSLGARALQVQEVETDTSMLSASQENESAAPPQAPPVAADLPEPPLPEPPPRPRDSVETRKITVQREAPTIETRVIPPSPGRTMKAASLALAALALGLGVALASGWKPNRPSDTALAPPSAETSSTSSASATAEPTASARAALSGNPPSPAASTAASTATSPAASSPTRAGRATTPTRSSRCTPPYTVDARGIKYPKMECL